MPFGYRVGLWPTVALLLSGCLRFGLEAPDSGADGDADSDVDSDADVDGDVDADVPVDAPPVDAPPVDAPPVDADEGDGSSGGDADGDGGSGCEAFASVAILSTVSSAATDWAPAVTADELLIFFESSRADDAMIYVAERATTDDAFGAPVLASDATNATTPSVSADGLELFYNQWGTVYHAVRASRSEAFSAPSPVVITGTMDSVRDAEILADGATLCLTLYSSATLDMRLALAVRAPDGSFALEPGLEELDEPGASEGFCTMSADGLEIVYESDRPGAFGVLTSRRASASEPFPPGVPLVLPFESVALSDPELSADGRSLYIGAVVLELASWDVIRASRDCE